MKRSLIFLMIMAIVIASVFAVEKQEQKSFNVNLKLDDNLVEKSFTVNVVSRVLDQYPTTGITDTLNDPNENNFEKKDKAYEFRFTVLWKMVETASPTGNKVTMKVSKPVIENTQDKLEMTIDRGTIIEDTGAPYATNLANTIKADDANAVDIIAFDAVSKISTQGGVSYTLTVSEDDALKAGKVGVTYKTTVTLIITTT